MTRRQLLPLFAAAMVFGTVASFGAPPPPPPPQPHHHGRVLPPGMTWCSKCDGDGYNRTWYGWAKKCHICNGTGMRPLPPPPPPPRHPAPVVHGGHKGGPAVHGGPAPKRPAPGPAKKGPAPKGGKGPGPR